jgi:phage baseplate assembly protein V
MERLNQAIRSHAGLLDSRQGQPRFGTVTSVDAANFTVRVRLRPDDVLTGWLPVLSPWVGAGWGLVSPPMAGDQVFILPQEGCADHGVVVGRAFSKAQAPPLVPLGELWLEHKSGSALRLTNDGSITIIGDLHVHGQVFDGAGSLSRLRGNYNVHTHRDSYAASTAAPDRLDQ